MKVRKDPDGQIEHVQIIKCKDKQCDAYVIKFGNGQTLHSNDFFMQDYTIIHIGLDETKEFNEFLVDTKIILSETWEFFEGKMQARAEMEEEKEEE